MLRLLLAESAGNFWKPEEFRKYGRSIFRRSQALAELRTFIANQTYYNRTEGQQVH